MAVVSSLSSSVETTTTRTTTTKMTTTIQKTISTTTKRRCSIGTSSSSSSSSSSSTRFLSCVLGMVQVFFFVLLLTLFVVQVKGWMSWIPVSSSSSIPHRFGCGSCFCNVATISSWTTTTRTRITTTTTPIHSRRSCYPCLYCYSPNGREPNNDKNNNNNNKQPMLAALTSTYSNNNTTLSLSSSSWNRRQCLIATIGGGLVTTATVGTGNPPSCYAVPLKQPTTLLDSLQDNENNDNHPIFSTTTSTTMAQEASTIHRLPGEPRITDQIFLDIKGLPVSSSSSSSSQDKKKDGSSTTVNNVVDDENNNPMTQQQCRLVIGLYGDIAPQSVAKIKALVSSNGLPAICRPRVIKSLTKEQLEANKVYNSCIERQDQDGVTWKYSTIWRVIPNIRIDIGAVTGKFVAREYPNWIENEKTDDTVSRTTTTSLDDSFSSSSLQNIPGLVCVRRGTESGFGITIATHGLVQEEESTKKIANNNNKNAGLSLLQSSMLLEDLHTNHIVVGRVLQDSMSIVQALNQVPVITTARQVNFMALTTTTTTNSGSSSSTNKNAPNRSCQYGGNLYCNEYKPLIKLTVTNVGLVQ